jgi:integrase
MALVHVRKEEINQFGVLSWQLYDRTDVPVSVFAEYCRKLAGLKYATRLRYTSVVARFIDYLYEVGVLGGPPVSRAVVNDAIDYYIALLRSGDKISLSTGRREKARYAKGDEAREVTLRAVAKRLGIDALAAGSWDNTLAALNKFLRMCALLEHEAKEIALLKGTIDMSIVSAAEWDYRPLMRAIEGVTAFSAEEVQHLKHSTMLGGVIRFRGDELKRPKGLQKSSRQKSQVDVDSLDFPEEHFPALLKSATSWRDRALWTLLLANGIRRSEALNLQWCDIDFAARVVYVLDPNLLRYGRDVTSDEREHRFKGRTMSRTYLRQPYRDWFFRYLSEYRNREYRLPLDGNDFVFQYLISPHYGRPLHEATDETLNSAFTSAVKRARIPGPPISRDYVWTGHSLRHAFGRNMLNDYKVPGQERPGLTEAEVQMLMGHKDIASTRKYARLRQSKLQEKLLAHDDLVIQGNAPAPCLLLPAPNAAPLLA